MYQLKQHISGTLIIVIELNNMTQLNLIIFEHGNITKHEIMRKDI